MGLALPAMIAGDGIIGSNDGEGFGGYLPIFPFDGDIECGSLIFRVHGEQGALMPSDALELPEFGAGIILLLNVVEDLRVGEDFLKLIIIDRTPELELFSIGSKLGIMVLDGLHNPCAKALSILLGF